MIELQLCRALRAKLQGIVASYLLDDSHGTDRVPQIVNGFLPPKRATSAPDVPFVIVRPSTSEATREQLTVGVRIYLGIFSEDPTGFEQLLNLAAKIRQGLFDLPCRILDDRYQLGYPYSWQLNPEQPYPEWQLVIDTTWYTGVPQILPEVLNGVPI